MASLALCALLYATVLLATLEVCARVDDHVSFGAPLLGDYSFDELKGVNGRGRPGARFEKWRINNLGFRGRDLSRVKPAGHFRVIVLGASESFGLYESPEMEYPAQLERMLSLQLRDPVEVVNAASAGMSLPRVIEFCARDLQELQPDIVVYYPTPVDYLDDIAPRLPPPPIADATRSDHPNLRIVRRSRNVLKSVLPDALQSWLRQREIAASTSREADSWVFHAVPAERLTLFETHLRVLIQCARAVRVPLVLATHANRFAPPLNTREWRLLVAWRRFYPRASEDALLEMESLANRFIRSIGREPYTMVADLAAAVPPDPRNFQDFSHFTDRGAMLAAAELSGVMLELVDASVGVRHGGRQ